MAGSWVGEGRGAERRRSDLGLSTGRHLHRLRADRRLAQNFQKTINLSTSRPRSAGRSKSSAGPTGTIPVGLMRRWLI